MNIERPSDRIVFCTTRISVYTHDGRMTSGTGFFYAYKNCVYLVTNKHVLKNAEKVEFKVFTKDKNGKLDYSSLATARLDGDNLQKYSCGHPSENVDIQVVDVVGCQIYREPDRDLIFSFINEKLIPDQKGLEDLFAIERIAFVGYPNFMWDEVNHLPIIRSGTTASLLKIDFNGEPKFLIDASVFPGSSGSPVFINDDGSYSDRKGSYLGPRTLFLGVISGVYIERKPTKIEIIPAPTTNTSVPSFEQVLNLGVVEKAKTVQETVELCYNKIMKK
ncbi:trypsin-like peptidase domain-containing protein [Bartonella sp. B10834G6]|uniref:trypsin-like peptidase domain-containing protein n=1 Tax=Bartonella apis TaxID=1686310 RepID=UPI0018DCEE13|nr:trypsin-like peptidase domain-containing protein [Bartonella apis]MBH9981805.1 trypsin-like peptidase domain-containing protein [Bartonella apis]